MRPINADALENALSKVKDFAPELCGKPIIRVTDMIDIIRKMPTVDIVTVRRGIWYKHPANRIECSECGLFGYIDGDHEYVYNFCPRCGADMREVEKND